MRSFWAVCLIIPVLFSVAYGAKKSAKPEAVDSKTFAGLKFRSIGPAYASGRIADFAVNPYNPKEYYAAVASGNIWKTENGGITFQPIFENYGAYSIGCLAMDPKNTKVVWAGTGENNHQRSVSYGDGVYRTADGGKTWKNMGLKESRHIGKILIDPGDSDTVYVAAEGSLWGPGDNRGLYKTNDGGKTWKKVLHISEDTGINDMVMDPRNPKVIYASSEQRRRHVHTKIGGGPQTAIYRTCDGGITWKKLTSGLPTSHMGGIGLAISPADPEVIYAIIEAAEDQGGFFRSLDRGESWLKMSSHTSSGQYYNEIFCDPKDVNKVYSVETHTHLTVDGGKTFKQLGRESRHVDDHALWIDPDDTAHLLIGGDGGIYETFDAGQHWRHIPNLPVTQFYRVNIDNSFPFYYVYGGTQDNSSMGGPSRNTSKLGVVNDEWFVTKSGDGFWCAIDPQDPNIVYSESQYGSIARYDRRIKERIYITPLPGKGEKTYKWNWNTPFIISPHSHTRLYCAANKVFRSDDRGDSWTVISGDLTAQINRNRWPVMGKYWSADAVGKDVSTSQYGTIVSLAESPVQEDLIYVGSDDGLIRVSEDGGKQWRKIDSFPGVPRYTYVGDLQPSRFDKNVVFAAFDNRKRDDFTPYLLKSTDKGKTWHSMAGSLPPNGTVHAIAQDHVKPDLLFVGTEFGIFFTYNGGGNWIQLKAGIPTISVRDIAIQERENDLVAATFGRGFYILDDYTPLREFKPEWLEKEAHLFPIKDTWLYHQTSGKYGQGATYYAAKNPPFGATFTYFLRDTYRTRQQARRKQDKALFQKGQPIPNPSWDELRRETMEHTPYLLFTVYDEAGTVIRELRKKPQKGFQRITWDLKYHHTSPVQPAKDKFDPLAKDKSDVLVMPGTYSVSIDKVLNDEVSRLVEPVSFQVKLLTGGATLQGKDRQELVEFQKKALEMNRVVRGAVAMTEALIKRVHHIKQTLLVAPGTGLQLMSAANRIAAALDEMIFAFRGHKAKASREEIPPGHMPILTRLRYVLRCLNHFNSPPTPTQWDSCRIVQEEAAPLLKKLKKLAEEDLKKLEADMEAAGAPWTPGRLPQLKH